MVRFKFKTSLIIAIFFLFIYFSVESLFPRKQEDKNVSKQFLKSICTTASDSYLLDNMEINCSNILKGYKTNEKLDIMHLDIIEEQLFSCTNKCQTLKTLFRFNTNPMSAEEKHFPLSYGMLVYKDLPQVLFLLSSIYHPQNEYCIAVGENSAPIFQNLLREVSTCFSNVHFMKRPPISWGSHEIIDSVYDCLEFLSHLETDWRYFQYLSGVDIPLKTNLEMVQILKHLNGTSNVEITNYQQARLTGKNENESPLPLFKSSLSAIIPRKAANQLASSNTARKLLEFLWNTEIADEGFWGTLFGNKDQFNISGSINSKDWMEYRDNQNNIFNPTDGWSYYISRDQIWDPELCKNYMKDDSCVFGIGDVPRLRTSKALVAHKFYLKSEPEAYFCLLKEHHRRTINPDLTFDASKYSELPQVELSRGLAMSQLTHQNWIL
ncbi:C-type lectin domain-containing protein [Caenorhabditis elegans]|uniref:C-type lectin domain-containing protein n=3 Tax=Caenorhabditis elegans TaxID=6239 RepID=G5EBK7_CAEEL|nr:C-type lectin domain-containing protein [Caenorhabditis elegans]AAK94766.1 GLY-19 [Caenorhabditis elegans]CAA95816.4 C-type lectin domain-containing protein [Caenorhabditis elegans]|eukprot:NP_492015.1 GLYcosylation related [Caenorhabditis elegans]